MSDDADSKVWRLFAIIFLGMATLGFGAAGLCGGAFTVMALPEMISPPRQGSFASVILFISLPSLLVGGGLAWLCGRALWRQFKRQP